MLHCACLLCLDCVVLLNGLGVVYCFRFYYACCCLPVCCWFAVWLFALFVFVCVSVADCSCVLVCFCCLDLSAFSLMVLLFA